MKQPMQILCFLLIFSALGCLGDGIKKQDTFKADGDINMSANKTDSVPVWKVHFQNAMKMSHLDKDTIGDYANAISELDKAISLNEEYSDAFHYRAVLNSLLENDDNAMADINRAISLDKGQKEQLFVRAALFAKKKNYVKAVRDLDSILLLDLHNAVAYHRRGFVKIQLGQEIDGCKDLKQAKKLGYPNEKDNTYEILCE